MAEIKLDVRDVIVSVQNRKRNGRDLDFTDVSNEVTQLLEPLLSTYKLKIIGMGIKNIDNSTSPYSVLWQVSLKKQQEGELWNSCRIS